MNDTQILFIDGLDRYFYWHRLALAQAAQNAGARIAVTAADSGFGPQIEAQGMHFIPLPMKRGAANPFGELRTLLFLCRLCATLKPALIHSTTIKPVIYGSFGARLSSRTAVVNMVSGLGYVFTATDRDSTLRWLVSRLYRLALHTPRSITIFQNSDDRDLFVQLGLVSRERSSVIRGAGVDCTRFQPTPEPSGPPVVLLVGRILWDKGIGEFVEAARSVKRSRPDTRFVLVGETDDGNPTSVPENVIDDWVKEGVVEWWGRRTDMEAVYAEASVVVLPSYREGTPTALLEAAACGKPLIAADVPGCRDVVREGVNGHLVPARDSIALASAIESLLAAPERRRVFGEAARSIVVSEYRSEIVIDQTLRAYASILGSPLSAPVTELHGNAA